MERRFAERDRLERSVAALLALFERERNLQGERDRLITQTRATLRKLVDDCAEVAFIGPAGAGKSTLIKALLGREVLYSGRDDYITGTECRILWAAAADRERAVLTYASLDDIVEELEILCQQLGLEDFLHAIKTEQFQSLSTLVEAARGILRTEGGSDRDPSPRAKLANALIRLTDGVTAHYPKIKPRDRHQETVADFKQAAEAARYGSHSAVLRKVEFYCCHPLLQGATLVDLPGWDVPRPLDTQLSLEKIRDPDVAAVICVLPVGSESGADPANHPMVSALYALPDARDRVFWTFNFRDRAWSDEASRRAQRQLKASLANERSCDTCAILGYYSPILATEVTDDCGRSGLEALNAASVNPQETQLFKKVLLDYYHYLYSQRTGIEPQPRTGDLDADYIQAVGTAGSGQAVMEAASAISGIPQLRHYLVSYLTQERRAQITGTLVAQLQTLGLTLTDRYSNQARELAIQPDDRSALESKLLFKELETLRYSLREIVQGWMRHLRAGAPTLLPENLQAALVDRLRDRLQAVLETLPLPAPPRDESVSFLRPSPPNALAPSLEAIAAELEIAAVACLQDTLTTCASDWLAQMPQQPYYNLFQTLADSGAEPLETSWRSTLDAIETALTVALAVECDRYRHEGMALKAAATPTDLATLADGETLPPEREAALRKALLQDTLAKIDALADYLDRAIRLSLQRSLQAMTAEDAQLQLYDCLSDLCRAQLEREIAVKARELQLENKRLKDELIASVNRYHQLGREIGAALNAFGNWDCALPEVPTSELAWSRPEQQWPTEES